MRKTILSALVLAAGSSLMAQNAYQPAVGINDTDHYRWVCTGNPIVRHKFSADPAPYVHGDTLWLYTGRDAAGNQKNYKMHEWNLYTTTDMKTWTEHPSPLHVDEFKWQNSHAAYAAHIIKRNGKWYFYVSTNWCGIGVAVADSPFGPFKDAIGKPLLTNRDCPGTNHSWACIDPFVMVDDDNQAWIFWGNRKCFAAKLKENMVEIDGEVKEIVMPGANFTEAPWVHKHNGKYYLTFAEGWPEALSYAVSDKIDGPYEYKGRFSEISGNSNTTHPGVVHFKNQDWLFTHNGALHEGTSYSRSVCVQPLTYKENGDLQKCDIVAAPDYLNQSAYPNAPKLTPQGTPLSSQPKTEAYLFAYFEGKGDPHQQEQIRFAVSENGVDWKALNHNKPILSSATISHTGGVRDPHIMRGADGKSYYMVATDMYTMKNGWGFNPGIVMMKSNDLVTWTHAAIDFTKTYAEHFGNVQWVWAPQTIYDAKAGKYLVYFGIRFKGDEHLDFYCAYANTDFTGFEHEPVFMFRADYGAIDADIIYNPNDGLYHFFFKGNTKDKNGREFENGIKQAVSPSLYGPWYEQRVYVDAYAARHISVEGSGVFKLNKKDCKSGSDEYILMYDLYRDGRYEFQRSTDLFHFTATPESFSKDFHPRHGTVMPITRKEYKRLMKQWGE